MNLYMAGHSFVCVHVSGMGKRDVTFSMTDEQAPLGRAVSDAERFIEIIASASARAAHDPKHLEQLAIVCDVVSRISQSETRDMVASVAAYALQGTTDSITH
jgi:hypothetical protein